MIPKPSHFGSHYAAHFKDSGIIDVYHYRPPYSDEVFQFLSFEPFDLIEGLEIRNLFRKKGERQTKSVPWRPSMEDYIESRHSQCGFPRSQMGKEKSDAFAAELREVMSGYLSEGRLQLETQTKITWGIPMSS